MTNAFAQWVAAGAPASRLQELDVACKSTIAVLLLIENAVEGRQAGRTTCVGCGCLCFPNEACPGCRARIIAEATAEAQAVWRQEAS